MTTAGGLADHCGQENAHKHQDQDGNASFVNPLSGGVKKTGMDQGDSACSDSHILTNWPCLLNVTPTFICCIGYF